MELFSFGSWQPDLGDIAELDNTFILRLTEAKNVVPEVGCYQAQKSSIPVTSSITSTCQGAFSCTDKDNNVNWFAGTATKLKRIDSSTVTWTTAGSGFNLGPKDKWSFVKYGNQVFAASVSDDLQHMTMSTGSAFSDVGNSAPRFRTISVVKNFLVGCGTDTSPQRVQWSAIDNPNSWTLNVTTMADFQDLLGPGGWIQGSVVGLAGADAAIIQEHAIWRMLYVGLPLVFQFDPVESARGAVAAGSIVHSSGYAFYYSDDGFYQFDGTTSKPIGIGKIDNFFAADVDSDNLEVISSIADATRSLVLWSYKSVSSSIPDKILAYNWQTEDWSLIDHNCDILWRSLRRHNTPLGIPDLSSFDSQHRATAFLGDNLTASITTAEYQFNERGRTLVTEIYPIIDGDSPETSLIHRKNSTVPLSSSPFTSVNSMGFCPQRADDRLIRVRQLINETSVWFRWKGFKATHTNTGAR